MSDDTKLTLEDFIAVIENNLLPSGSCIFDTSASKRGRQVYPKPSAKKRIEKE